MTRPSWSAVEYFHSLELLLLGLIFKKENNLCTFCTVVHGLLSKQPVPIRFHFLPAPFEQKTPFLFSFSNFIAYLHNGIAQWDDTLIDFPKNKWCYDRLASREQSRP